MSTPSSAGRAECLDEATVQRVAQGRGAPAEAAHASACASCGERVDDARHEQDFLGRARGLLGEDLVLFRDRSGNIGLLADHCAHRGASLLYGRVEERGIACAYHGWLYDTQGDCLECPAEPADSRFHLTVKQRAYPVRERYGLDENRAFAVLLRASSTSNIKLRDIAAQLVEDTHHRHRVNGA